MRAKIILAIVIGIVLIGGVVFLARWAYPDIPPLYNLRRFEEKIIEYTKTTPDARADYYTHLLQNRLDDIPYVGGSQEYPLFLSTSLSYSATAGTLSNWIISHSLKSRKATTLTLFNKHSAMLKKILSKKDTQDEWKFIQDDVNYLSIYKGKVSALH